MSWSHRGERSQTRTSGLWILILLGGLFTLIGVGLLVGASWSYDSTRRFVAGAASTTGTLTERPDRVRPERIHQGTVPVYVDPDDPRRYLVDTSVLPAPGNAPEPKESA